MEIKTTQEAAVEMADNPAMNSQIPAGVGAEGGEPPVAHPLVSLFQCECSGVLAIRSFSAKLLRTSGCAVLTGIAW